MLRKKFLAIAMVFALIVPVSVQAGIFSSMIEGMTSVTNNMVDGATETTNTMITESAQIASEMLELMSKLSDDIGKMAERILVMADKIGEMADRIVETERIMTDTMLQMQAQMNELAGANSGNSSGATVSQVLLNTEYGSTVYGVPEVLISDNASEYLLYVSGTAVMGSEAVSVLIRNEGDLEKLWPQLTALGVDGQIYIAVKSINQGQISALSNTVMLSL